MGLNEELVFCLLSFELLLVLGLGLGDGVEVFRGINDA